VSSICSTAKEGGGEGGGSGGGGISLDMTIDSRPSVLRISHNMVFLHYFFVIIFRLKFLFGKQSCVYRLEELILFKCPHDPK
jgi:hypothetical protein